MATSEGSAGPPSHRPETWALRALSSASSEASAALARRMRMNATDLSAMNHVTASSGRLGPREISARLGITPAAMTDVVDRLEAAGHLQRQRDTTDRRRVRLVATESAATEVRAELRRLLDSLDRVTDDFSPDERDAVQRYLKAATEAYSHFAVDEDA